MTKGCLSSWSITVCLYFSFHLKTNEQHLSGEEAADDVKTRLKVALMRLNYARLCSDPELSPFNNLRLKQKADKSTLQGQISKIITSSVLLYAPICADPRNIGLRFTLEVPMIWTERLRRKTWRHGTQSGTPKASFDNLRSPHAQGHQRYSGKHLSNQWHAANKLSCYSCLPCFLEIRGVGLSSLMTVAC